MPFTRVQSQLGQVMVCFEYGRVCTGEIPVGTFLCESVVLGSSLTFYSSDEKKAEPICKAAENNAYCNIIV